MNLFITPQEPYYLSNWSFTKDKKPEKDRSSFLYLACVGVDCGQWEFTITISVSLVSLFTQDYYRSYLTFLLIDGR